MRESFSVSLPRYQCVNSDSQEDEFCFEIHPWRATGKCDKTRLDMLHKKPGISALAQLFHFRFEFLDPRFITCQHRSDLIRCYTLPDMLRAIDGPQIEVE